MRAPLAGTDHAQQFLLGHLRRTEELFLSALRDLDPTASCQISAAADLCLPHDVIRIAGGFATGCLVQWSCSVPVLPVDTTVNIDTSSIFWLDRAALPNAEDFERLRRRIELDSSYEWNFHKGNHFISFSRTRSNKRHALVIHSNEKEFKYQFNGLMPVPGNWFMDDVRVFRRGQHYLRLLIGDKVLLFRRIADMLQRYNVVRHRFLAEVLLSGRAQVEQEYHKHHYFMPTEESVAIGCFLCAEGEIVPIFSRPGGDITLFAPASGGSNLVLLPGVDKGLLVPHGWGKTIAGPVELAYDEQLLTLNGHSFNVEPRVTLGVHPDLIVRAFSDDPLDPNSLFSRMAQHTPGRVTERLQQLSSYSRVGFVNHTR